ncbi:MAG: nucleotide exchange factor GrpE [Acidimicrobiales bacterium]|nr:nucleotide exchange factor GrpE [Acidimicrobiales bacterium]
MADVTEPIPESEDLAADGQPAGVDESGGEATEAEGDPATRAEASVEELIVDLERVTGERDGYLDQLRRNQAEFENIRKRLTKEAADASGRAVEQFAERLLPVLDACESAIGHGAADVEPIYASLLGTLEKEGLGRIPGVGEPFDPNVHEAVFHEPAEEGDEETVVVEVLRPGYVWNERTLRPSMVKVRG